MPLDHGPIEFDDAVYGHVSFPADVMDDMIVVRTDGTPTYNFAVVCDDANMGITHVIRGDDHLSNTPRQILIYEALGYDVPTFAHLSMILGPDGKKLSKRHGAASVEEFRDRGFLPDAMVNFLALLGWSLDGETTLISRDVLCSEFSLDRITKKGRRVRRNEARVDERPVHQGDERRGLDRRERSLACARPRRRCRRCRDLRGGNPRDCGGHREPPEFYEKLYPLVAERETRLVDAADKLAYMFWGPRVEVLDEKSVKKVLLKEGARADEALAACRAILADESRAWEAASLEAACRELGEEDALNMKLKLVLQPLRVAVCGNMVSRRCSSRRAFCLART